MRGVVVTVLLAVPVAIPAGTSTGDYAACVEWPHCVRSTADVLVDACTTTGDGVLACDYRIASRVHAWSPTPGVGFGRLLDPEWRPTVDWCRYVRGGCVAGGESAPLHVDVPRGERRVVSFEVEGSVTTLGIEHSTVTLFAHEFVNDSP